jgi:molybdate/tungstate transport system substrate-binding protein
MPSLRPTSAAASSIALVASLAASQAGAACVAGQPQVIIYHAGSLTAAFTQVESLFTQQTGICVVDVAAGSVDAARRITAGHQAADIYASANKTDIDVLLKPAGYADYAITFAKGAMVLAYNTASRQAGTIVPAGTPFNPPGQIPAVASDWYQQLTGSGVLVGGSNPFLDPSGYRADLMFQLAEKKYGVANLYDILLGHYSLTRTGDALGTNYDYQFIYEHSAYAAYLANPASYRYARLPDDVGLSNPALNDAYAQAEIVIPGLHDGHSRPVVRIPGERVIWGLTVLKDAPNAANAIRFLELLFGPQGVAMQTTTGPEPVSPPLVSATDFLRLPSELRPLVKVSRN